MQLAARTCVRATTAISGSMKTPLARGEACTGKDAKKERPVKTVARARKYERKFRCYFDQRKRNDSGEENDDNSDFAGIIVCTPSKSHPSKTDKHVNFSYQEDFIPLVKISMIYSAVLYLCCVWGHLPYMHQFSFYFIHFIRSLIEGIFQNHLVDTSPPSHATDLELLATVNFLFENNESTMGSDQPPIWRLQLILLGRLSTDDRRTAVNMLESNTTSYDSYCKLNQEGFLDHITMLGPVEEPVKRLLPEFGNCPSCWCLGMIYTRCQTCPQFYLPTVTLDLNIINPRFLAKALHADEHVEYKPTDKIVIERQWIDETELFYNQLIPAIQLTPQYFYPLLDAMRRHLGFIDLTPQMKMLKAMTNAQYLDAHQCWKDHMDQIHGYDYKEIHIALNPWGTHERITQRECVGILNEFFLHFGKNQKAEQGKAEEEVE